MPDLDDENREILFEQDKMLAPGMFKIQISQNESHFYITANRVAGGEGYVIELPNDQTDKIISEFNGDYKKMSEYLEVLNRQLVLLNPQSKDVQKNTKKKRKRRRRRAKTQKRTNDNGEEEMGSDEEIDDKLIDEIDEKKENTVDESVEENKK